MSLAVPLLLPLTNRRSLSVYAASLYKEPVKNLIYKKFSYDTLACKQMGELMVEFIPFDVIMPDVLVPVPLHWSRFAWRGYNQSELIAQRIGKLLNVPVINILKRNRRTIFQSRLSSQDRQKNVENVFCLNYSFSKEFEGKNIVIVDDLFTSGATVKSAAKVLVQLNSSSITAAVFCRAI